MKRGIQRNLCHVKYRDKQIIAPPTYSTATILRCQSHVGQLGFHFPHPLPLLAPQKETNAPSCHLQFIIDKMTLSVDGFLAKIGSMGRFQWILVCVVGVMLVPVTFQTLIMTFLGLEPPWRCVRNSSVCNFTRKCPAVSFRSFKGFVGICSAIVYCSLNCFDDEVNCHRYFLHPGFNNSNKRVCKIYL